MRVLDTGRGNPRVSFSPDGTRLAVEVSRQNSDGSGGESGVAWYDTRTWAEVAWLSAFDCLPPNTVWVDRDGEDEYVGDGRVEFPEGPTAYALSPDHTQVVLAWPTMISWKWQQITWWDISSATSRGPTMGPREAYVDRFEFAPGGARVAYFADEPWFHLGFLGWENVPLFRMRPTAVAFSPDGELLAYGDEDGSVRCWATATPRQGMTWAPSDQNDPGFPHRGAVRRLRYSPDGQSLAVGTDEGVALWRQPDCTKVCEWSTESAVADLSWHPAGRLVVGTTAGRVMSLDAVKGITGATHDWGIGRIHSVAFSPDGLTCAAGGENGQVVIWDVDA